VPMPAAARALTLIVGTFLGGALGCATASPNIPASAGAAPSSAPASAPTATTTITAGLSPRWPAAYATIIARALESHAPQLLDAHPLPKDEMQRLCPGYSKADRGERAAFWNLVFAAIARPESNHNPQACMRESAFKASKRNNKALQARFERLSNDDRAKVKGGLRTWLLRCHEPRLEGDVYSEGLLQLSYGDQARHSGCRIDRAAQALRAPEVQLECGVIIMRNQLRRHSRLFVKERFYYWSVLTRASGRAQVLRYFDAHVSALPFCKAAGGT